MALFDELRSSGVSTPSSGTTSPVSRVSGADLASLLGKPRPADPVITSKFLPTTAPTSQRGQVAAATINPEDQWGKALGRELSRIEQEMSAWDAEQSHARDALAAKASDLAKQAAAALEAYNQQYLIQQQFAAAGKLSQWRPTVDINQLKAAYDALKQQSDAAYGAVQQFDTTYQDRRNAVYGPMQKNYQDAVALAQTLRDNSTKQAELDKAYEKAKAEYENAVTQFDKDRAAYDMYKAQKAQYDTDVANRQADIDAGRYAVNPYAFLAQGASLPEIMQLRDLMNAGNARPNMRVPAELVAPTEVKDPGTFSTAQPVHEQVKGPVITNAAAANILGYEEPAAPPPDAPVRQVSTEETDTSSVKSNYSAPESDPKPEEKPKDSSGNVAPAPAPATNNLQQTAATSTQSTQTTPATQQTAAPAPALPEQTSGTVSGQGESTGQPQPTQQPEQPAKAKPFDPNADENKDKDNDNVFES